MKIISFKTAAFILMVGMINTAFADKRVETAFIEDLKVTESIVEVGLKGITTGSGGGIVNTVFACTLTADGNLSLESTHNLFDEIYSMLLTAKMAQKQIAVMFQDDPRGPCSVLQVNING